MAALTDAEWNVELLKDFVRGSLATGYGIRPCEQPKGRACDEYDADQDRMCDACQLFYLVMLTADSIGYGQPRA